MEVRKEQERSAGLSLCSTHEVTDSWPSGSFLPLPLCFTADFQMEKEGHTQARLSPPALLTTSKVSYQFPLPISGQTVTLAVNIQVQ